MTTPKYENTVNELVEFMRQDLEKSSGASGSIEYPIHSIKPETISGLREHYSQNGYVFGCEENNGLYVITVKR